jgi:hypothetical protein
LLIQIIAPAKTSILKDFAICAMFIYLMRSLFIAVVICITATTTNIVANENIDVIQSNQQQGLRTGKRNSNNRAKRGEDLMLAGNHKVEINSKDTLSRHALDDSDSSSRSFTLVLPEEEEFHRNFKELQRQWDEEQAERRKRARHTLSAQSPSISPTEAPTLPPSTLLAPPNCIIEESEIVFVHDLVSFESTLDNCLKNIPDPLAIPVMLNGTTAGVMEVGTNIQLNNLHVVSLKPLFLCLRHVSKLF